MMHIAKYKKHQIGHLLAHYARTHENYGNESIDKSQSCQNYNLAPDDNHFDRLQKRLNEVYVMNRKDVNLMCDCILTAPADLNKDDEERFFHEAYNFLSNRFGGEKNVISAWVHKDEVKPTGQAVGRAHLHFCWVPCVLDKKKKFEKVSAFECVTRDNLRTIHQDLQCFLSDKNIHCSILTGETKTKGNKSILELKTQSLQQNYDKLAKDYVELANATDELKDLIRQQKTDRIRERSR